MLKTEKTTAVDDMGVEKIKHFGPGSYNFSTTAERPLEYLSYRKNQK